MVPVQHKMENGKMKIAPKIALFLRFVKEKFRNVDSGVTCKVNFSKKTIKISNLLWDILRMLISSSRLLVLFDSLVNTYSIMVERIMQQLIASQNPLISLRSLWFKSSCLQNCNQFIIRRKGMLVG